ncbi:nicotinate-nucleotide adenylyltransferase [Syntrophobotulus glycolicus DSM 8271]|uniref:Probable nicotinate-nucleotide adenylyltransferase n=1 Tax=Syntrophobotulus glycolicus (strain DSM 8271 / FlGlyR) TaxID=645991 RepID=F0SVG8_SYNGF|nr:nicotinate-nucleotide adenylyltransferase [Syntrophobotulus glycolicus]ADY56741.1 nicotinate-nucleotide adenylyltransferase [Syntrophobotulus glycolicus DSM 8271]
METEIIEAIAGGKHLGIMGGTFDPIHYGHLVAAETARTVFGLDNVLFIPTGIPPHKNHCPVTDPNLRYEMVRLSIRDNSYFKVSRLEIERDGPTYTIDTLRTLKGLFPQQELYFITGSDVLEDILAWREPNEIIRLARIIGASRPGYDAGDSLKRIYDLYPEVKGRITELEIPALAISSTDIRIKVKNQRSIRYLLPEEVRLYIKNNHLYEKK